MSPHLTHAKPGAGIAASPATKPANLICSHCQGHLVADLYIDTVDAGGHVWIRARRCVRCGTLEETGRVGYEPQGFAGNQGQGRMRKGLDDEMIVLGT
ncbi:MAG: hypothetical protein KF848_18190 [Nitrospira sp.]|nr:hypothetical protein [Nitrospira sp.]